MNKYEARSRVAVFLPHLGGGGAERMMLQLANSLAKRGFSVDLVLARAKGEYFSEVSAAVRVHDLGSGRAVASLLPLIRYLRQWRPQALFSAMNHLNVIAVWARWCARVDCQLIVCVRSNLSQDVIHSASRFERLLPALVRWSYPQADAILSVSQGVEADLSRYVPRGGDKMSVIYNPIVNSRFRVMLAEECCNDWLGSVRFPFILGVGRLTRQKDFGMLIRAFARLREEQELSLVILGEGPERKNLEALAKSLKVDVDVHFPGFVQNPFPIMRCCSVFALSSLWEGLPGVLIQALAAGAAVVSTDCPSGAAEILENGRWGILVPVGDSLAMAQGIAQALEMPERDIKALEIMLQSRFGEDEVINQYVELLDKLGVRPGSKKRAS